MRTPLLVISSDAHDRSKSTAQHFYPSRLIVLATLIALVVGVTACQSDKAPASTPATASPAASVTPSVDPSVSAATSAAITAYQGYVAAYAHAAASADVDDPNLAKYIGGGLLILSQHNLRQLAEHGAIELGTPTATVTSTTADLTAAPPTVTVNACIDYSTYRLVYKSNQSPVPNSALAVKRYATTATVQRFAGGAWLVSADTPHRDTPC